MVNKVKLFKSSHKKVPQSDAPGTKGRICHKERTAIVSLVALVETDDVFLTIV